MKIYEYGNKNAAAVLIQPVGDHELAGLEAETHEIKRLTNMDFRLMAVHIKNWNRDLSPWPAPAAFGNDAFGEGAKDTLREIMQLCHDEGKRYIIGGYSLAGLFSLWAAHETKIFSAVAAASPSMWFPGFIDYIKTHEIKCSGVYLSLGDKEEKIKNPVMKKVGDCIREAHSYLEGRGINCTLEWNQGNHFKDTEIRTAKAFAWALAL